MTDTAPTPPYVNSTFASRAKALKDAQAKGAKGAQNKAIQTDVNKSTVTADTGVLAGDPDAVTEVTDTDGEVVPVIDTPKPARRTRAAR